MSVKQSADEAGAVKDDALQIPSEPTRGEPTELPSLDEDDEDIKDGFDEVQEIQDRCGEIKKSTHVQFAMPM